MSKLKASRETKSKAYKFIKSLLNDGADGTDVHNLVSAINDNINEEIGGNILMDLLINPADENADEKDHNYWFGPFGITYFCWITNDWSDFCKQIELKGTFRFGGMKEWEKFNKAGKHNMSAADLKRANNKSDRQLCVFEWTADAVTSKVVTTFLANLYKTLDEHQSKK
jgi:hypothetical protein